MRRPDRGRRLTRRLAGCAVGLGAAFALPAPAGAAIFPVTSNGDSGAGTLRAAIGTANSTPGADEIDFGGAGEGTITPLTALPAVTGELIIDGGQAVTLDGSSLSGSEPGLSISASNSAVAGMTIQNFPGNGIEVGGSAAGTALENNIIGSNGASGISLAAGSSDASIVGNRIGIDATGTTAQPNAADGIVVAGSSHVIGGAGAQGNVISGNTGWGIHLTGGSSSNPHSIRGNTIGADAAGTGAVPNGSGGVLVAAGAAGTTVGGSLAAQRNLISGNTGPGVRVAATGTTVAGNLIGLDKAGSSALANGASGVEVAGTPGVVTVGGAGAAANVISGNGASGVNLTANGAVVKGNLIGTDTTGTTAIGNTDSGVLVAADNDQVGVPGAGNVISGNGGAGIEVDDTADANGAIIKGNRIGTDAAGTAALPNGAAGIEAREAVTIGGTYAGAGNVISANTGPGVVLNGSNPAQSSTVRGNTIGLDLAGAAALGNVGSGIDVEAGPGGFATHAVIGGAGAGNLISANGESGVFSDGTGVTISGNRVGVEADGTTAAGNGASGIRLGPSALNNVIGGDAPADGNLISNSTGDAIAILAGASGNQVKANTGAGNADLFIDLGDDGPGNPGVQGGVLPPVITVAGPQLARGTAPAGATVRVFSKATPATGELEAYLGSASADNTGHWRVDYTFGPTPLPNLKRVVATQTDPIDGTSELSAIALTDAIAPARPTIQSGPDGPTSDATPTFTFTGDPASALECRIDSGPVTACDAGTYTASALGDGPHTFSVTATDLAENTSAAASRSFSVDTQAKTTITKKPKSKIKTKKKKVKVKVKFKSEQGATFKCKLDKAGYKPCTSPYAAKVKSKPGKGMKHKISIKATDPLGNVSKPATVKFKVIRKKK